MRWSKCVSSICCHVVSKLADDMLSRRAKPAGGRGATGNITTEMSMLKHYGVLGG